MYIVAVALEKQPQQPLFQQNLLPGRKFFNGKHIFLPDSFQECVGRHSRWYISDYRNWYIMHINLNSFNRVTTEQARSNVSDLLLDGLNQMGDPIAHRVEDINVVGYNCSLPISDNGGTTLAILFTVRHTNHVLMETNEDFEFARRLLTDTPSYGWSNSALDKEPQVAA